VIIPLFDLFNGSIANYGIIILLLTLIIKLVVSPLTIKSYMSSAKMNVLRPEIEKINAKYPKEQDAMKKQQEIMALYQKAGVSMFGGCLPMLLQFPILIAMFRFFPASIELRQQPFLWAEDLSTYDSIIDFGFNIPLLGDHISLFSLLCAVTMYFSAKLTQGAQMDSNPQAKSMKFMTLYFMPIFMFFICNNLSSGLTYYYFLSNIIMMIQTIVIRKFFVDEKKIMEKIRLASVKGANKPKSKFQQRLEAMQKAQQEAMREQQKNRR
jgi:YidC/Oxa1 family membrane protein insertase